MLHDIDQGEEYLQCGERLTGQANPWVRCNRCSNNAVISTANYSMPRNEFDMRQSYFNARDGYEMLYSEKKKDRFEMCLNWIVVPEDKRRGL